MKNLNKQIAAVEDGRESPLKLFAEIKLEIKDLEEALERVKTLALAEADKYGGKEFNDSGFRFKLNAGRRFYDFSGIPDWKEANDFIKEKEELYKSAASAWEKGNRMFDEVSGEQIALPVVKISAASLSVNRA